jgi:hypothetical protein
VAVHTTLPVFASKATTPALSPPMLAMTSPPSTSGEPAAPKYPFGTLKRFIVSSLQTRVPLARSTA